MAFFKKLSAIEDNKKNSVYGWIREAERDLRLHHVPLMISGLCILYFDENDKFNSIGNNVQISNEKKTIEKVGNHDTWDNMSYGEMIINSKTNYICKWRLKIRGFMCHCIVGISDCKETDVDIYELDDVNIYGFTSWGTKYRQLTSKRKSNDDEPEKQTGFGIHDEVEIALDPIKKCLKCYVNGSHQNIDHQNIELSNDYRIFVAIMDNGAICDMEQFRSY